MQNSPATVKIRFENHTVADAARKAANLRSDLLALEGIDQATIEKDDPTTQDFGATLVLVLGTEAVIAIAKGIADYLRRNRGTIVIEADGKVVATGLSGENATEIAKALAPSRK
jgi:hypothetical protein